MNEPFVHVRRQDDQFEIAGLPEHFFGHRLRSAVGTKPDGIFAEWSWDRQRLTVRNDRYGFYPLYYFVGPDEVCVSPSISQLLARGAPAQLDYPALAVFLRIGFFLAQDTPFREIRAVPPDAIFEWDGRTQSLRRGLPVSRTQTLTRRDATDAYVSLFRAAVLRRIRPERFSVVALSGGRDSRHILLELCANGHPPTLCATVDIASEQIVAAQVTRAVNVEHVILGQSESDLRSELRKNVITSFCADEHAWILPLRDYLQGRGCVVYDGIGGDVLSAGLFLDAEVLSLFESGRLEDLAIRLTGDLDLVLRNLLTSGQYARVRLDVALEQLVKELARHADAPNPVGSFYFWNRTRREISLSSYRILGDVAEEVFSPYLDHEVYDLLASLPATMFLDHTFHTDAISAAHPRYAHLPYAVKGPPDPIAARRIRRFAFDLSRYVFAGPPPLWVRTSFLLPRLMHGMCGLRPRPLWFGGSVTYLLQLERLVVGGS